MPRVPRYEGQVQEQGIPGVRFSTQTSLESFGGGESAAGVTRAFAGAVNEVAKVYEFNKAKADDSALKDYEMQALKKKNELMHDPNNGALNKSGKDAFNVTQEYGDEYKKFLDELDSKLSDDNQKAMARNIRARYSEDLNVTLNRHTSGQIKQYEEQQTKAGVELHMQDAILNYGDPTKVQGAIQNQKAYILDYAQKNGVPPERSAIMISEAESKTHYSVMNRMLNNNQDQLAENYFKQNKDKFVGTDALNAEKVLEEGILRGKSQRFSDGILRKGLGLGESLEEARKISDPKLRDETTRRIKDLFSEKKAAEEEVKSKLFENAAIFAEQNKDRPDPETWLKLDLNQRNAIDSRIKQLRQGIDPETSWTDYYDLKTIASNPSTKSQFLKMNLMEYRPKMADAEFKELINLQTGLRNGDSGADAMLDGIRTDMQVVNDTLRAAGMNPTPKKGTNEAEKVSLFRAKVDEQVAIYKRQTGSKSIGNDKVQEIVDNLLVKGEVPGTGFFGLFKTKRSMFEVQPGEQIVIEVDDIPKAELNKIKDAMQRRGIPYSDQKAIELYSKKTMGR